MGLRRKNRDLVGGELPGRAVYGGCFFASDFIQLDSADPADDWMQERACVLRGNVRWTGKKRDGQQAQAVVRRVPRDVGNGPPVIGLGPWVPAAVPAQIGDEHFGPGEHPAFFGDEIRHGPFDPVAGEVGTGPPGLRL